MKSVLHVEWLIKTTQCRVPCHLRKRITLQDLQFYNFDKFTDGRFSILKVFVLFSTRTHRVPFTDLFLAQGEAKFGRIGKNPNQWMSNYLSNRFCRVLLGNALWNKNIARISENSNYWVFSAYITDSVRCVKEKRVGQAKRGPCKF